MNKIFNEDCLITMNRAELSNKVDLIITSPPYIAIDNKVINTKTNRVLKPSSRGSYKLHGKYYQHNVIFNIQREETIGKMLKDNKGNVFISIQQACRKLKLSLYKVEKLIDYGELEIL